MYLAKMFSSYHMIQILSGLTDGQTDGRTERKLSPRRCEHHLVYNK